MPRIQDEIFSAFHRKYLKQLGFQKRSSRSERAIGKLHQCVACFSSRFNSADEVKFTLEVRLNHEDYFHLFRPRVTFSGMGESLAPLWHGRPKNLANAGVKWWQYKKGSDIEGILVEIGKTWQHELLPLIQQMSTLEGLIDYCRAEPYWDAFQPLSWALSHSDRANEARDVIAGAISNAPHENARQFAIQWQQALFAAGDGLALVP